MDERMVGLDPYLTDTPGTGGGLRATPLDFRVIEIPVGIQTGEGEFTIAKVTATNWENNRLLKVMSQKLKIPLKAIGFAGTKDKRAVTTQWMTFPVPESDPSAAF